MSRFIGLTLSLFLLFELLFSLDAPAFADETSDARAEMTQNNPASLTEEAEEYLKGIDADINIVVVDMSGSEGEMLKALLDKIVSLNPRITYSNVKSEDDPDIVTRYGEVYFPNSVIVISEKRSIVLSYFSIFFPGIDEFAVYEEYSSTGKMPDISDYYAFNGKSEIIGSFGYVLSDEVKRLYLLEGHGSFETSLSLRKHILRGGYELEGLDGLSEGVPDDCDCLVINVIQTDISEPEKEALLAYIGRGGRLLVSTQPEIITEEKTEKSFSLTNLYSVLEEFGVSPVFGIVLESEDRYYFESPYMLLPEFGEHAVAKAFTSSEWLPLVPVSHALSFTGKEGCSVSAILTSSSSAYISDDPNSGTDKKEGAAEGRFVLAAASEKETEEGKAGLVWFGSYAFACNDDANKYSRGIDQLLFLDSIDWLTGNQFQYDSRYEVEEDPFAIPESTGESETEETKDSSFAEKLTDNLPVIIAIAGGAVFLIAFAVYLFKKKKDSKHK